ncbi:MAG: FAD-dependent oxidoreductase [Verrucomicrobiales bacterium]|jgi:glycine/D-amino acid oxidase-like deaminating enzyme|nr:FAD-dependent oxidoreductase [Verrucomicrobiales bacterium]MDP5006609.1 FAD-dependent oxidoreductase [Verrucomicrobiales bacterium]
MPPAEQRNLTRIYDTVIIGGGVAALWTANVLKNAGQSVVVLTNAPLGEGQSLAAQGVIHGGLKYAVGGKLTDSSEALAAMPGRWLAAMRGEGPVDLSGSRLLCDHQLMWSLPNMVSQVVSFFGSKALRGRSAAIAREDYPAIFDTDVYKGKLFRIDEPVVDPVSIIRELARGVEKETYLVEWKKNASIESTDAQLSAIVLREDSGETVRITASRYVLAAGAGNGAILSNLGIATPAMQLRPLHQLIIRKRGLPDFFSVCVGTGPKPPLVSTTHVDSEGRTVWYIGGDIAEQEGVARTAADQIAAGKALFAKLMPWIDLADAEWFTWRGNRAEPLTGTGDRPPGAYCERIGNVLVAWPTKLALAPNLADQVLRESGAPVAGENAPLALPRPGMGRAPWDLP